MITLGLTLASNDMANSQGHTPHYVAVKQQKFLSE